MVVVSTAVCLHAPYYDVSAAALADNDVDSGDGGELVNCYGN